MPDLTPAGDLHDRLRQLAREVAALVERGDPATEPLAALARLAEASGDWVAAALGECAVRAGCNEDAKAAAEECLGEAIRHLLTARQHATVLLRKLSRELDGAVRAQRANQAYQALAPR